jgi:hypothetical protein
MDSEIVAAIPADTLTPCVTPFTDDRTVQSAVPAG